MAYRVNQRQAIARMANRTAFMAAGLSGIIGKASSTGRLPQEWREKYRDGDVAYTIMSYATPIAWIDTVGNVTVPDEKYSVTTSRHQSLARYGLST